MLQKVFPFVALFLILFTTQSFAKVVNHSDRSTSAILLADGTPPGCNNFDGTRCKEVKTAIGPIPTDPTGLVQTIFGLLLGISGGVAVLLIIASGYEMMTSQGNPEKVKGARERLTSAIVGLLFIIFSITILQTIGVDILHIPGISR